MELPAPALLFGGLVTAAALYLSWRLVRTARPAAFPGGPRARRIYRSPKWPRNPGARKSRACKHPVEPGWRYVEGALSHQASEARFGGGHANGSAVRLTGESAGRQTWQYDPGAADGVTEYPTQPFDASKNPNSADLIYRRQQLLRVRPDLARHRRRRPLSKPPNFICAYSATTAIGVATMVVPCF